MKLSPAKMIGLAVVGLAVASSGAQAADNGKPTCDGSCKGDNPKRPPAPAGAAYLAPRGRAAGVIADLLARPSYELPTQTQPQPKPRPSVDPGAILDDDRGAASGALSSVDTGTEAGNAALGILADMLSVENVSGIWG